MLDENRIVPIVEYIVRRDICRKTELMVHEMKQDEIARKKLLRHRLYNTLVHAGETVPFYRLLFKKLRFRPEAVLSDEKCLEELPYVTKEMIHLNPEDFLSEKYTKSQAYVRKTSGSTGRSLDVYYDAEALDWTAAVNRYVQLENGRTFGKKETILRSELSSADSSLMDKAKESLKCMALNRSNIFIKSFDSASLERLHEQIRREKPYLVQGHPSTVYHLALHLRDVVKKPLTEPLFAVFESTGETISDDKAEFIHKQLGCTVYNKYGAAEFGVVAYSANDINRLKIVDTCFYVENFIYGFGLPEIVVTGTLNSMMPLIRYRTGDLGEVVRKDPDSLLINLMGRVNDVLEVNDKFYPTHYLKDQLANICDVDDFQIVVSKANTKKLMIVASDLTKHATIRKFVKDVISPDIEVHFVKLNQLIRVGWRDKFKYLIYEQ